MSCDCYYCPDDNDLYEPYHPPFKVRMRRRWNSVLYRLHLKKRPPYDLIVMAALDKYKESIIDNLYNESPIMTYLKENNNGIS